jgi:hypothetical protein
MKGEIRQKTITSNNETEFDKLCNEFRKEHIVIGMQTTTQYDEGCIWHIAVMLYEE